MESVRPHASAETSYAGNDRKWAKALHDGPCQDLTTLSLFSDLLARTLQQEGHPMAEQAMRMRDLLKKTADELRTITRQSANYRPRNTRVVSDGERPAVESLRVRHE